MEILTVRRRFEAYSSGTMPGAELPMAVVDAVRADPRLAKACTALVAGYFESRDANQALRDSILADITSLATADRAGGAAAVAREPLPGDRRTMLRQKPSATLPEPNGAIRAERPDQILATGGQ